MRDAHLAYNWRTIMAQRFFPAVAAAVATALTVTSSSFADDPFFMGLGPGPGGAATSATAISADGQVIVGGEIPGVGFRWTMTSGMTALPLRPGDVSADGTVIIGNAATAYGCGSQ